MNFWQMVPVKGIFSLRDQANHFRRATKKLPWNLGGSLHDPVYMSANQHHIDASGMPQALSSVHYLILQHCDFFSCFLDLFDQTRFILLIWNVNTYPSSCYNSIWSNYIILKVSLVFPSLQLTTALRAREKSCGFFSDFTHLVVAWFLT